MKKMFFALSLLFSLSALSQNDNRIKFEYDSAGNQTRRFICLCEAKIANDSIFKNIETLVEKDMIQDVEYEQLSFYPNPVLEELYIKWSDKTNNPIVEMQLYSMSGQLLQTKKGIKQGELTSVSFHNYATGIYNLILIRLNGERKTLKIVKE
ncbi:T9SS type A sorting domain-containing protein [Flavobacterium sp.]|jgi:hypothetical protein|uniref:T9SS type A sorting domain-containing protein n=1 Tax=Flavobacterium sp. TaxID=239 RepID=UPI0037C03E41